MKVTFYFASSCPLMRKETVLRSVRAQCWFRINLLSFWRVKIKKVEEEFLLG
jgi:hypothetical protein